MALEDLKITENDLVGKGVTSLTENQYIGDADMLKTRFDSKPDFIIERYNSLIDAVAEELGGGDEDYLPTAGGTMNGNIVPDTDNTRMLGSNDSGWANIYSNNFAGSGGKVHLTADNTKILDGDIGEHTRVWAGSSIKAVVLHGSEVVAQNYADTAAVPMKASAFNQQSSLRYKENIKAISKEDAEKIYGINIVTYVYKNDEDKKERCGVIAEQLEEIGMTTPLMYDAEGRPDSVSYPDLVPYLIKIVQMQKKQIDDLNEKYESLTKGGI